MNVIQRLKWFKSEFYQTHHGLAHVDARKDQITVGKTTYLLTDFLLLVYQTLEEQINVKSMPGRFIGVLLLFSEAEKLSQAVEEWTHSGAQLAGTVAGQCICGQEIQCLHFITNSQNDNVLQVGSSCLEKLGFSEACLDQAKFHEKRLKNKTTKRPCLSCGRMSISPDKPDYVTRCKKCFQAGAEEKYAVVAPFDPEGRLCEGCEKVNIEASKPDYVTLCRDCFQQSKATCRPCETCGQKKIPSDAPQWKKICGACYYKGQ